MFHDAMTFQNAFTTDEARWEAVRGRQGAAAERFLYAVKSTGVFCRPGCASRLPRRENVVFYDNAAAAVAAGFRPCKRCQPAGGSPLEAEHAAAIARACQALESGDEPLPNLEELARLAGMSSYHFHRVFRQATGLTPGEYARGRRQEKVRRELAGGSPVTQVIYEAGYGSSSRFYAQASAALGMAPTRYRRGGVGERIRFAVGQCSLGGILVASTEQGVCAIFLGDDPAALVEALQERFPQAQLLGGDPDYEQTIAQVVGLVQQGASAAWERLPLDVRGTAFQQNVWLALREIPPGGTATYTEIAARIGAPRAVRAVGAACGANPVALAIPCHRVIRTDGGLSGYRWGIERKAELLRREAMASPQAG